jgi:serine/threonine-protein kinase
LNQRVAVKVMARELASNPEALARFRREAEITSRLRHPHLVTVMDFGTAPDGQPYLVMEHLEGLDLEHRIRQLGTLPLPAVVNITQQVASALGAAHDQGIVHRDLKPANVFLVEIPGEPDFVKILDFGISKIRAATTQLTKASAIIGTPNYMSPEQATGMLDEIDHRTDQWAVACIVWEMLSGRPPFASDDISAVFYQVIHLDPQPLRDRVPDLPPAVDAVLRRALSKTLTNRFPSVANFASALASAATEPADRGGPAPTEERTRADGTAWVERRRPRRERRQLDEPASGTHAAGGAGREAGPKASSWRSVRPVHVLSALAMTAVAILLALRWNQSAKAAPVPMATQASASTPARIEPIAAMAAPLPATAPAPAPAPAPPAVEHRAPVRNRSTKAVRHAGDSDDEIDPFAPRLPASKHRSRRATKADADFVDPFGP